LALSNLETKLDIMGGEIQGIRNDYHTRQDMLEKGMHEPLTVYNSQSNFKRLLNVQEMKQRMQLPCNYIHDGFYLKESNEIINQAYASLMTKLHDDDIPVIIEVGGHDGITKSTTLKASRCLQINTLLIEASPANYNVLKNSRSYDWTVHGALCEDEYIYMESNNANSGENHVASAIGSKEGMDKVRCTSIDREMDNLKATLPDSTQDKLVLLLLILDVEGYESIAVKGNKRYKPMKVIMETHLRKSNTAGEIEKWIEHHSLSDPKSYSPIDTIYNFDPLIKDSPEYVRQVFYGARKKVPVNHYATSKVSPAYMFYGEDEKIEK